MARTWSGVVPQQPPISDAPRSLARRAKSRENRRDQLVELKARQLAGVVLRAFLIRNDKRERNEGLFERRKLAFDFLGRLVDAVQDLSEFRQFVQPVLRLPALPGLEIGERRPHLAELSDDRVVDGLVELRPEFPLPDETGEHPQHVGGPKPRFSLRGHGRR